MRRATILLAALVAATPGTAPAERSGTDDIRPQAEALIEAAMGSDHAWMRLSELCDGIGHRLSGSEGLERAVAWAEESMRRDGLENVRRQPVMVPHWIRGEESATMLTPRRKELAMLGLGRSVGTPKGGVSGRVVVFPDFDAFDEAPEEAVRGNIVLWNVPFTSYGKTVAYRWDGPRTAAGKGAVASLVRSVGPRSLDSPHTGVMAAWEADERAIPAAALSIEDATLIARLTEAGHDVTVHLEMGARTEPDALSYNVMGEITGRELPNEVVVIGGHLDSWDVGSGAYDDGGGCVTSLSALHLMHELGLRPRRTVRVVFWTNEENGTRGADEYGKSAREGDEVHVAAIESDGGVEAPWGFGVSVWKDGERDADEERQERAIERVKRIAKLLHGVQADSVRVGGGGADISPLMEQGTPGLALRNPMKLYWDLHHTHADTMDKVDPDALRRNVAAMAVMAYA
ncbi:M20/M25/M40 family metallo-hydrolase, partial [bacterium]|nr:M20/M25/M40 family metallo-hydrolase [bacterium]